MFCYWAIFSCQYEEHFFSDSANIFPPSHCLLAVDGIFCCTKDWAFHVVKYSFNSFWESCVGKVNLPQFLDCTCSLLLFQEFYCYLKTLNLKLIWSFFHMVCAISSTLLSFWLKASCARFFFFFLDKQFLSPMVWNCTLSICDKNHIHCSLFSICYSVPLMYLSVLLPILY